MRRCLNYLLLIGFAIVIIGCNRSSERPNPPVANSMSNTAIASISILATPASVVQQPAPSPISLPTVTPGPPPVTLPTSLPYLRRYSADGRPIEVTPIPATPLVTCTPQDELIACYDELLDMHFSYPTFMGYLLYSNLRKGGISGYAYEYVFKAREDVAGGRSRDFSEGREGTYTDQSGYNRSETANVCAGWTAMICQELRPGILLLVMLPQVELNCSSMMFTDIPRSLLILDLPQHPLINGFAFSFQLMPSETAQAFRDRWYTDEKRCTPETNVELGAYVEQLRQDLEAGTADAEIQQRYDAIFHMAESIQSPFVVIDP